jgi:hypothetical protein
VNGTPRSDSHRPAREERPDGVLTLARAFQLMSQALSEFRSPVGQEALRLRMVAMHGREDPLLDAARFPRLLRQANDAEVADVRKVGDDDYEIAAQGSPSRQAPAPAPLPPPTNEDLISPPVVAEGAGESGPGQMRENGQRLGLRFRRGSRGTTRASEIPLIGVVRIDSPVDPVEAMPAETMPAADTATEAAEPAKRPRPRRPARKRAATAEPFAPDSGGEPASEAPPPRRPRTRSRKKPE